MNALVPKNFGAVASVFANQKLENDLSAGVQTGFGLVGYKGKVWSIKYRGAQTALMRPDGDGPLNSIEVAIVKASSVISKIWYKDGYVEGSSEAPDCFSTNGVTPDLSAKARQSNACASCAMNAWGARTTTSGKAGKACTDSKRLAVVPLQDLHNDVYGGPMLLRVPAASLNDLAQFGNKMQALGYPYSSIGIRIAFDAAEAFPKFQFSAIRALSEGEANIVAELQQGESVGRVLAEASVHSQRAAPAPVSVESAFEIPPTKAAPVVVTPAPVEAPAQVVDIASKREYKKKPVVEPVQAAPEEVVRSTASFDDELDAQLNGLLDD